MKNDDFMQKLSVYRYRAIWLISSVFLIVTAHFTSPCIVTQQAKALDIFSYWGTVATIIALIISIFEVIQNATIAKSITSSINEKVEDISKINKTALLSEAGRIIDQIIDNIDVDKFSESAILIRELQKNLLYSQSNLLRDEIDYKGEKVSFAILEHKIVAYRASGVTARVTKGQKLFVKGALIILKQNINFNNPGRK